MRDDLHKTVPVSAPWRKVLHRLGQYRTDAEIAHCLVAAVHADNGLEEVVEGRADEHGNRRRRGGRPGVVGILRQDDAIHHRVESPAQSAAAASS